MTKQLSELKLESSGKVLLKHRRKLDFKLPRQFFAEAFYRPEFQRRCTQINSNFTQINSNLTIHLLYDFVGILLALAIIYTNGK